MYDMIIKGGKIIDGSGGEPYVSDIAVKDGKIQKIATKIDAGCRERVVDATGLVVTPGFIDSHSHADNSVFSYPDMKEKVEQGITTAIMGMCGGSAAPLFANYDKNSKVMLGDYGREYDLCKTAVAFMENAVKVPEGCNLAFFVGHGSIRGAVLGRENRAPTKEELEQMKSILRDAMRSGAYGMSLGLYYTPGYYADMHELTELAGVVAEEGGVVSAHVRGEEDQVIDAAEEFIKVIKDSGARGVHSHIKATGKKNYGKVKRLLEMIEAANAEGADIYCDVYPYVASHTTLSATFVPPELHADDKLFENLRSAEKRGIAKKYIIDNFGKDDLSWALVVRGNNRPECIGRWVSDIAKERGCDPYDAVFDIILDCNNETSACYFRMDEGDLETAIKYPRTMICTDSSVARDQKAYHPRLRATFPRAIGRYARDKGVVPLAEMIRKVTSLPAHVYGLKGKGLIREGYDADICVFSETGFIDRAEFTAPTRGCEGLNYVIVAGEIAAENGVHTGVRAGRVLRKNA